MSKNDEPMIVQINPKSHKIVSYHNDLNRLITRTWSLPERHLFALIITKLRDKNIEAITLNRDDLKELLQASDRHKVRFEDTIEGFLIKIHSLALLKRSTDGEWTSEEIVNMFQKFRISWKKDKSDVKLTAQLSPEYTYFVNSLNKSFTTFELSEYFSLHSSYSAICYQQLKQWRLVGKREFDAREFRILLGIPDTYDSYDITRRVLKPIEKELSLIFKNLKITKTKKGRKIVGYKFTWTPEVKDKKQIPRYTKKRIEHGTDWSKKKAVDRSDVDTDALKEYFKEIEDKN